jgi:hypothetical protein
MFCCFPLLQCKAHCNNKRFISRSFTAKSVDGAQFRSMQKNNSTDALGYS